MKKHLLFILIILLGSFQALPQGRSNKTVTNQKPIAILGAFDEEVRLLQEAVQDKQERTIGGIRFVSGKLNGRRVVVAETGIGKVNAAMTTTIALMQFSPASVIFTGIAGGINPALHPGDIVIARTTTHHDYESITFDRKPTRQTRNAVTKQLNPAFFPADSILLLQARQAAEQIKLTPLQSGGASPQVLTGIVVTGDQFISSSVKAEQLRTTFSADATEMEGAAVAQVCYQQNVPCLVIRSLSDKADEKARDDMLSFYKVAARNSAALVMAILGKIE